jgi:hypothetical protein
MSLFVRNIIISLIITLLIIGTIVYAVNYLNHQRVVELDTIESQLTTDTLSVETQYALLANAPCEDFTSSSTEDTTLSQEVSSLGEKLASAEKNFGVKDKNVQQLRRQYTLLEIRDYLLTKQLSKTCNFHPIIVLYFYSNTGECKDECSRASYTLSVLHNNYPNLRVYSFDYNLNLAALKTLIAVEKVEPKFPAFVINGKTYYGFTDFDDFKKNFPASVFATSTATSTASAVGGKK